MLSRSPAPPPPRTEPAAASASTRSAALLGARPALWLAAALTTLIADAALGARGWPSLALTVLAAALLPAWLIDLVRMTEPAVRHGARHGASRIERRGRAAVLGVGVLALACLGVKAWIAWRSIDVAMALTPAYRTFTGGLVTLLALGTFGRPRRIERFLATTSEHPARLMGLSFGLAALAGSFLLSLPVAFRTEQTSSFIDALFTSVSAVCVTGLTVNNVAQTYSIFGQAVLLVLMQIGGLGIMVLSAFFAMVAGRKLAGRNAMALAEMIDAQSMAGFKRHVASIVLFTLAFEAVGVAALYAAFSTQPALLAGGEPRGDTQVLWAAVFHAVSAFCNAGFSIFEAGAVPLAQSWTACLAIMALVVLGGLGFPVHAELLRRAVASVRRRSTARLSLHTRVVLSVSAALVVGGALALLVLEWDRSMRALPLHARALAALFQSVSARTAGFNTLDVGAMAPATLIVACLLMFIGGSPGSTAGGIKTSTLAALFANFRAELRKSEQAVLYDRALPESTLRRALGVTCLSAAIVVTIVVLLCVSEREEPLALMFEAVSAFATVGLSTGITADLSPLGKGLLIAAMFVGRSGPLTLALLFADRVHHVHYLRPEERLAIG